MKRWVATCYRCNFQRHYRTVKKAAKGLSKHHETHEHTVIPLGGKIVHSSVYEWLTGHDQEA